MFQWTHGVYAQATGSWDHTVRLWTLKEEGGIYKVFILKGHKGNVHCAAFSREGMLVSIVNCQLARIFRFYTEILVFISNGYTLLLMVADDWLHFVTGVWLLG